MSRCQFRRKAAVILLSIDVAQRCREGDARSLEVAKRVGKGVRPRPAHAGERREQARGAAQADEPIASVGRTPEHRVGIAEQAKGACDVACLDGRDVAADDDRRPWRQRTEQALHPRPEIALALRLPFNSSRPERRAHLAIRRHRKQGLPAGIARKPHQRMREARAVKSRRGDRPDACREPALGASGTRALGHHDKAWGVCSAGRAARFSLTHKAARARAWARGGNRAACRRDCAGSAPGTLRCGSVCRSSPRAIAASRAGAA